MPITFEHIHADLEKLQQHFGTKRPDVAVILGSGLGSFVNQLTTSKRISYTELPHFPRPGVQGHKGDCYLGSIGDKTVLAFCGRFHYYEGHNLDVVTLPVRLAGAWKIKTLVVTNASGGIHPDFVPGDLMFIQDQINLSGVNPLRGPNMNEFGERFVDMSEAYDQALREHGKTIAKKLNISTKEGVYIGVSGPCYETPAEIRAFRTMGADAVGMSTVPEVIVAKHHGMKVLGISMIANYAAGTSPKQKLINHQEVLDQSKETEKRFCSLLQEIIHTL